MYDKDDFDYDNNDNNTDLIITSTRSGKISKRLNARKRVEELREEARLKKILDDYNF